MKVCLTSLTRFRKQEILGSGLDQLLSVADVPEEGGGSVCGENHHVEVPWLQKLLTGDLNLESLGELCEQWGMFTNCEVLEEAGTNPSGDIAFVSRPPW